MARQEYRKQYRKRKGVLERLAEGNRRAYHKKIKRLLDMQAGLIPDPDDEVKAFVRQRMWKLAKWRAKRDNLEFDIAIEDIELPEFCPILGHKLQLSTLGKEARASYSLDRIHNDKGYIKGNIAVISKEANATKSSYDLNIFLKFVAYLSTKEKQSADL